MSKNGGGIASMTGQLVDFGRSHGLRGLSACVIASTLTASTWLLQDDSNLKFIKCFGRGWGSGMVYAHYTIDTNGRSVDLGIGERHVSMCPSGREGMANHSRQWVQTSSQALL
jgi:hypothetical protein